MNYWKISTLVLCLAFVGVVAVSASSGDLQGKFSTTAASSKEASDATIEATSALSSGTCTTCQVLRNVLALRTEVGDATWTVQEHLTYNTDRVNSIYYMVDTLEDEIGASSWTVQDHLSDIGGDVTEVLAGTQEIMMQLGPTSWDLESLAEKIWSTCSR